MDEKKVERARIRLRSECGTFYDRHDRWVDEEDVARWHLAEQERRERGLVEAHEQNVGDERYSGDTQGNQIRRLKERSERALAAYRALDAEPPKEPRPDGRGTLAEAVEEAVRLLQLYGEPGPMARKVLEDALAREKEAGR